MERSSRQWLRRAGRDGRAAMVMLLIAATAPAVSAAGQEASSQPAKPHVEAAQAIPKVALMTKPTGEQQGEEKKAKEESGKEKAADKEKAPRMVLQLDLLGNFRLVPETPGC